MFEIKSILAQKAFASPQLYRDILLKSGLIEGNPLLFSGKTFICVSLTRFCPVGCKFCFFKSGPAFKKQSIEDKFNEEGTEKFIDFANKINLGYLLVSGGGEPMIEKKNLLKIIRDVKSERIVLVTSANWAKNFEAADSYLTSIQEELKLREAPTSLTVRVSVDSEHVSSIGLDPIINLIRLFSSKYKNNEQMELQIHSLIGDSTVNEVISKLSNEFVISRQEISSNRISDGISVVKIVPKKEKILFGDMIINVGYAKSFYSDLKVNLNKLENIQKNLDVYQKDLYESEDGNSSIVTNELGEPGLDFWVNYNGNVTTWGNQFLDNLFNLYMDTPEEIINGSLSDPAALAFIEKGADYRDRVVSEANTVCVIRSKAVNIRDYTGALMFDEARTRLYFTIRALQDYMKEGRVNQKKYEVLPEKMKNLLNLDKEILIQAYKNSSYTIVQQIAEENFNKDSVLDIMEWVKLGHYDLSDKNIQELLNFYNKHVQLEEKVTSFENIINDLRLQNVRMTEHLTHIKPLNSYIEERMVA